MAWPLKALMLVLAFLNAAPRAWAACEDTGSFFIYSSNHRKYMCSNITREQFQIDIEEIMESNQVKQLELIQINIPIIDTELFTVEKYSEVYNLTIKQCGVTTIEDKSFNKFIRLDDLYIVDNNISNFNGTFIESLPDLDVLDISNNKIQRFNITCKNLKHLILNNNSLKTVQTNSLHNCDKLREIQMRNSNIKNLQKDVFLGLHSLRILDLTDNPITNIEPGAFNDLHHIYILNLTDIFRNIKELKRGVFTGLKNLENFNLTVDNVEVIEPGAFTGLDSVEDFNTKYIFKNINRIQKDQFKGLLGVSTLDLSVLNIIYIETGAFNGLDNVRTILLQNNNISSIDANAFKDLHELRSINLSNTSINANPFNTVLRIENITELVLSNNSIGDLRKDYFSGLKSLQFLDISFSNIANIEPETFYGMKLKSLNLRSNRLTTFPCNIFDSNNEITVLYLNMNQIENINICAFQNLLTLGRLYLQYNKISHLEDRTFSALGRLWHLDLSHNMLSDLSEQLLHPLDSLVTLDISDNRFTHFNPELVLPHLKNLNHIILFGNPWSCRNLISIRKYLRSQDIQFNSGAKNFTGENIGGMKCTSENVAEVIHINTKDKDKDIELNRYVETINNSARTLIDISKNANSNEHKTLEQLKEITGALKNVFNSSNRTLVFFKTHFITNMKNSTLYEEDKHYQNAHRNESQIRQDSNDIYNLLLAICILVICCKLAWFGYKMYQKKYEIQSVLSENQSSRNHMELLNNDGGTV